MRARDVTQFAAPLTRVLLVDDYPVVRAGVKALLSVANGFQVVAEAGDGSSAVLAARELPCDVVLMDVSLPGLTSAEATRKILAEAPSARVLAFSGLEEPSFARLLLEVGAAGYALKRSACEELLRALRIVASGGTYVDPVIAPKVVALGRKRSNSLGIRVASLSEREAEVIRLIAQGHATKEMAADLGISPRTLETYKARAMAKLNLRSRAELIRYALGAGWLRD